MADFRERPFILQPGDADVTYTFRFPVATSATANDGAIPFGTEISSAAVTISREDTGADATSEIIQQVSNNADTVTVDFTYPTTAGAGAYYLKFVLTLDNNADYEFDYVVECIDKPLGSFIERIKAKVMDASDSDSPQGRLVYPSDYVNAANEALQVYSNLFPLKKVVEMTGDGEYSFALPADWSDETSILLQIEYPTGYKIPRYLYSDEYMVYDNIASKVIRFLVKTPASGEKFRVTYTTIHSIATLPAKHVEAVNFLAASYCCYQFAVYYGHTSDPLIRADSVKYEKKSKEFLTAGEKYHLLFKEQVGIGIGKTDIVPAASIHADYDYGLSQQHVGRKYLTHNRRR